MGSGGFLARSDRFGHPPLRTPPGHVSSLDMSAYRMIVEPALRALDPARSSYFARVVGELEQDARFADQGNLPFLVLSRAMPSLPAELPVSEMLERLHLFVRRRGRSIAQRIHSRQFLDNPAHLDEVTDELVAQVVDAVFARLAKGEIVAKEKRVYSFSFPYDAGADLSLPFAGLDDDDEER